MELDLLMGLGLANFLAGIAPGQSVALIVSVAAGRGVRAAAAAMAGILCAKLILCLGAILTLRVLVDTMDGQMLAIRALSAVLLIAMGAAMLWDRGAADRETGAGAHRPASRPSGAARAAAAGLLTGLANPLALIFSVAVLPRFMPEAGPDAAFTALALGTVLVSTGAALLPYVAGAALIRRHWRGWVEAGSGFAMIGLGGMGLAGALA